jgi:hypothetical protein
VHIGVQRQLRAGHELLDQPLTQQRWTVHQVLDFHRRRCKPLPGGSQRCEECAPQDATASEVDRESVALSHH